MKNLMFISVLAAFLLTGCSFFNAPKPNVDEISATKIYQEKPVLGDFDGKEANVAQNMVLNTNDKFLLSKYVGKKTGHDCSSFVSIVNKDHFNLYYAEKDVMKFYDASGRKSKAIFNLYESKKLINFDMPTAGDLVFFANTMGSGIKKNKDKKNITHVGIVTQVFEDATIEFVHYTKGKIYRDYMNLIKKDTHKEGDKNINSYVVKCKKNKATCLASHRFAGYGKVNQDKMPKKRD
ncbi:hypothetical protein U5B43_03420 [Campylobacter sp. 9BO]|uniref:hypothetical protein n=1 Tax=Campylobacter sp. 9BO TaxID=3424759 RepID=UPI003D340CB4